MDLLKGATIIHLKIEYTHTILSIGIYIFHYSYSFKKFGLSAYFGFGFLIVNLFCGQEFLHSGIHNLINVCRPDAFVDMRVKIYRFTFSV